MQPQLTVEQLQAERARLKQRTHAYNTTHGYKHDFLMFRRFCERMKLPHLPADTNTVCLYLTSLLLDGRTVSTAGRRSSAIAHHHRDAGHRSPVTEEVRELLNGARRIRQERPRQASALSVADLRKICELLAEDPAPIATRNRALMLVGFCSALRRSNLITLMPEDVEFCSEGAVLTIPKEKNNQKGITARFVGLPFGASRNTCPVLALRAWMAVRGPRKGSPLFTRFDRGHEGEAMSGDAVSQIVKFLAAEVHLDPVRYSGHSLRCGFITAAFEAQVPEAIISAHTGHRSMYVLRRYYRRANLFVANPVSRIGL